MAAGLDHGSKAKERRRKDRTWREQETEPRVLELCCPMQ